MSTFGDIRSALNANNIPLLKRSLRTYEGNPLEAIHYVRSHRGGSCPVSLWYCGHYQDTPVTGPLSTDRLTAYLDVGGSFRKIASWYNADRLLQRLYRPWRKEIYQTILEEGWSPAAIGEIKELYEQHDALRLEGLDLPNFKMPLSPHTHLQPYVCAVFEPSLPTAIFHYARLSRSNHKFGGPKGMQEAIAYSLGQLLLEKDWGDRYQ